REGERDDVVIVREVDLDRILPASDPFLDLRVVRRPIETRMEQRVVADLVTLLDQLIHLLLDPRLTFFPWNLLAWPLPEEVRWIGRVRPNAAAAAASPR